MVNLLPPDLNYSCYVRVDTPNPKRLGRRYAIYNQRPDVGLSASKNAQRYFCVELAESNNLDIDTKLPAALLRDSKTHLWMKKYEV